MHKDNWDDLRFVLAVAEIGSVNAAARRLGVNHATVLRRIAAFEAREGTEIFERTSQGYRVPLEKADLITAAKEVEQAVQSARRLIRGSDAPLEGQVRVTSTDSLCQTVLPEYLAALRCEFPGVQVDLVSSNTHLDLAKLDADLTVRPAAALPDGLSGHTTAAFQFAVYGSKDGASDWLGLSGPIARSAAGLWIRDHVKGAAFVASADSFVALAAMAAGGLGQTILPTLLGDAEPRLARREVDKLPKDIPIWVATHADLANTPRIRAVQDFLCRAFAKDRPRFSNVT